MFSGFSTTSTLLAGQHDPEKERPPPSLPTPVKFPSIAPPVPFTSRIPPAWSDAPSPGLFARFVKIKKPSDVNIHHLAALNVSFESECDFETLLSSVPNGLSYLPPKSWLESPEESDSPAPTPAPAPAPSDAKKPLLSNGRMPPDRKDFYVRAKELYFANDHAFSVLTRRGKSGQAPPRLAHFRRFWEGLDNMAYYWDDSLDVYTPAKPGDATTSNEAAPNTPSEAVQPTSSSSSSRSPEAEAEAMNLDEPRKKAKTTPADDDDDDDDDDDNDDAKTTRAAQTAQALRPKHSISSSSCLAARASPPKVPPPAGPQPDRLPPALLHGSYRGSRIGSGAEMPDQYRLDAVRAFVEPLAWAFGLALAPHRRPPALAIASARFPVRMSTAVWRAPADRLKARSGWLEGPVLGVQCRPETNFGAAGGGGGGGDGAAEAEAEAEAEAVLDATRELGGLLLLAQERAREGRRERRPGEGKWWVTRPRWGGGPGGEVGEASGGSDVPVPKEKEKEAERPARARPSAKERRKVSAADAWRVLRPGGGVWDPRVVYEAIGKGRGDEWDEVFMVSSLNHHIRILKLRVHPLYLQYLTDGTLPAQPPADPSWVSPKLQRTRWFDFFVVEDRAEAMRGIWGIMAYLMRMQETADVKMDGA